MSVQTQHKTCSFKLADLHKKLSDMDRELNMVRARMDELVGGVTDHIGTQVGLSK